MHVGMRSAGASTRRLCHVVAAFFLTEKKSFVPELNTVLAYEAMKSLCLVIISKTKYNVYRDWFVCSSAEKEEATGRGSPAASAALRARLEGGDATRPARASTPRLRTHPMAWSVDVHLLL